MFPLCQAVHTGQTTGVWHGCQDSEVNGIAGPCGIDTLQRGCSFLSGMDQAELEVSRSVNGSMMSFLQQSAFCASSSTSKTSHVWQFMSRPLNRHPNPTTQTDIMPNRYTMTTLSQKPRAIKLPSSKLLTSSSINPHPRTPVLCTTGCPCPRLFQFLH